MAVRALLVCYCGTFLLSAILLFSVQPMIAKMVLPLFGGTPAVWTTCMVFFQAALLAGYGYAYLTSVWLTVQRQIILHLVLVMTPLLLLPIAIPTDWAPATNYPTASLLAILILSTGLPFFVVSTTAPLLQKWFAETSHPTAGDPYYLYAISNVGSMAALLSYPIAIEPTLRLGQQAWSWAAGYYVLGALIAVCAVLTWYLPKSPQTIEASKPGKGKRRNAPAASSFGAASHRISKVSHRDRLGWVILAFVPSSWMLAVTSRLTTDIAPIPLLWVIPLSLYLLTFILVFSRRQIVPHDWMVRLFPFTIILLVVSLIVSGRWQLFAVHLLAFFFGAMVCHGELARRRPATQHLTQFYLWMSLGGVLGGMLNALIAPLAFPVLLEFPIVVALACALHPGRDRDMNPRYDMVTLVVTTGLVGLLIQNFRVAVSPTVVFLVIIATPLLIVLYFSRHPKWFAVIVGVLLVWDIFDTGASLQLLHPVKVLHRARSFFGVHTVVRDVERLDYETGNQLPTYRRLFHGTTQHGFQHTEPERACEPLAYFHRRGPLGDVFEAIGPATGKRQEVAVIGLGSGASACYALADRSITFYEIDPVVKRIAETPDYFTYLSRCGLDYRIVLGDGRLKIAEAPDRFYSMIMLDAFSSDAIPTHLLTREALALYQSKLTEGGVLVFHVSNLYLDLVSVLADLAPDAELTGLVGRDVDFTEGKAPSTWVAMARSIESLGDLPQRSRWQPLPIRAGSNPWTDDFSNIISILRWNPEDVARGAIDPSAAKRRPSQ